MFNDITLSTGTNEGVAVLIDGPTNRKTIRAFGHKTVTIAHGDSNENNAAGVTTQRSNVRINLDKEIEDSGKTASGYVQLTLSVPKDVITEAEVKTLVAQLLNFLMHGETPNSEEAKIVLTTDLDSVPRLYAGEP
jgi:hypothetical protein